MNNYLIRSTGERFEKKIQDSTRKRYGLYYVIPYGME